jgi:hypothetical protein
MRQWFVAFSLAFLASGAASGKPVDDAGQFARCTSVARQRGATLVLSVKQNGNVAVAISSESWFLNPRQAYTTTLAVDELFETRAVGTANTRTQILYDFAPDSEFLRRLQQGAYLRASAHSGTLMFGLRGAALAGFKKISACVARQSPVVELLVERPPTA